MGRLDDFLNVILLQVKEKSKGILDARYSAVVVGVKPSFLAQLTLSHVPCK